MITTNIEMSYINKGIYPIVGVDEAGRGALAGPVVACALILPNGLTIDGVNDSKKLSPKRRISIAEAIEAAAIEYSFGVIEAEKIDEINILQAALLAMEEAVNGLTTTPKIALVDGNKPPNNLLCKIECIVQGDAKCHLIAAASILAKVKRDTIMEEMHHIYPQYGFATHKGYGTVMHKTAISQYGVTKQHRRSFKLS